MHADAIHQLLGASEDFPQFITFSQLLEQDIMPDRNKVKTTNPSCINKVKVKLSVLNKLSTTPECHKQKSPSSM